MIGRASLAAAALALLAGCAGAPRIANIERIDARDREVQISTRSGVQPVIVAGAPPDGASPEAVVAALRPPPSTSVRFEPGRAGETEALRLVLEFGRRRSGPDSCRTPSGGAGGGDLVVAASLCRRDGALSSATLIAPGIAGPSDPAFARQMQTLLHVLYTPENPPPRPFGGGF